MYLRNKATVCANIIALWKNCVNTGKVRRDKMAEIEGKGLIFARKYRIMKKKLRN